MADAPEAERQAVVADVIFQSLFSAKRAAVRTALEQFMVANGAASVCRTFLDPMTDDVMIAVEAVADG